jgi:glycine/D-amino acid oxidase-like deaminating enzyme
MEKARSLNTLVIGAGQAGLATSYWLTQHGVEHLLLERRSGLGGAWQDRWDSFYLNTPNFFCRLPGLPYDGSEPDVFIPRDAVIGLFRDYAQRIAAPVQLGTEATRISRTDGTFMVETTGRPLAAANVILAIGAFQHTRIPRRRRASPLTSGSCTATSTATRGSCPAAPSWWWAPASPAARSPRTCWTPAARCTCPFQHARRRPADTAARMSSTGSLS